MDKPSYRFFTSISRLFLKVSDVKVGPIYKTVKVGNDFKSKSDTLLLLVSNVVYGFTRS